jgi:hypothetical protein
LDQAIMPVPPHIAGSAPVASPLAIFASVD